MKFTSIVITALVAFNQFSSTFAAPTGTADTVFTEPGVPVTFDVLANDSTTTSDSTFRVFGTDVVGGPGRRAGTDLVLTASATVEVPGTVSSSATFGDGTITFAPTAGFTGVTQFEYSIKDSSGTSGAILVTIKVQDDVKLTFLQPKQISTFDAVGTVRGGLFKAAEFTLATPDDNALDALLNPVTDVDNFAVNTSFQVVNKSFTDLFVTFFGIFRGGN
jgi:hypothetical protein